ncbi:Hypothetical predicted protein [Cloeon dipterum]|uniref:EGF-like domain-containing protein n=1 Tax=Cloeon dipterum TaxID=197152 RepID=A0A8S1CCF0_9INSE|nr:Hypothetical predicted protein [Cloeon dipterum]
MAPVAVLLLLLAALQPLWAFSWDVAVASEGQLDLLLNSGKAVRNERTDKLSVASGLVYLPKQEVFLLSNSDEEVGSSIFTLKISERTNTSQVSPLIEANSAERRIFSLAYDPQDDFLYWADWKQKAILKAFLPPNLQGPLKTQVVHKFVAEIPTSVAIDHCRRKLYWSNVNYGDATIESSDLDGSNRVVLLKKGLRLPNGIALNLRGDGRLLWVDNLEGIFYSVNSARLDGSEHKVLYHGRHQEPNSLVFDPEEALMWNDRIHDVVWRMDLKIPGSEPYRFFGVEDLSPLSVAVKTNTSYFADVCKVEPVVTTTTVPSTPKSSPIPAALLCLNGGEENTASRSCKCLPGFSGAHCEVDLCHNYCLKGGVCVISPQGAASCHCPPSRSGERCEIDLCQGLCLNGGFCHLNLSTNHTVCHCVDGFEGERCERRQDICTAHCNIPKCSSCEYSTKVVHPPHQNPQDASPWSPLVLALGGVCTVLIVSTIFLVIQVLKLRRRPRLKRRVIVSRKEVAVPSFQQPQNGSAGDTCEITIENCCNMNICETPCFEPPNRLGHKVKEDKKTLLANMEDSEADDQETSKESSYS